MKQWRKAVAVGCSVVLAVTACSGCAAKEASVKEVNAAAHQEVQAIEEALDEMDGTSAVFSHSDTAGKVETVYGILDASGNVEQVIVSEWLKNGEGAQTIQDETDLQDITVVKGDAFYTTVADGKQLQWDAQGNDVYYQGVSENALPVTVSITYALDGTEVTAEELAGTSGHLKMTLHYENQMKKETTIQGKTETIYQPFLMISGMMLDNDHAKNITVDNGKAVNSGENTMVFGLALPGLQESLGLDAGESTGEEPDWEIPETVTVEADVTDFSLMMTLTLASNDALTQLGLDDIDTVDDLKADMEKLTDGMQELVDGADQLSDGVGQVQSGATKLDDGASDLTDGTSQLSDGAKQVSDGAAQVNEGAAALQDGLKQLKGNGPALAEGVNSLTEGAGSLAKGIRQVTDSNEALTSGATKVEAGLSQLNDSLSAEESKAKLAALCSGSAEFSKGLEQAADSLSQITAGYDYNQGDLANLIAGLTQYAQGLAASEDPQQAAYAQYIMTMMETYKKMYDHVASAQSGVSALANSYSDIDGGIMTTSESVSAVASAVSELQIGASQLKAGVHAYTSGVSQAAQGVNTLHQGLKSLNGQVPELVSGINQLSDGANRLAAGTKSLKGGAKDLASGAGQLDSGSEALKDGTAALLEGVNALAEGTGTLKDGLLQFREDGIEKLAKVVNEDLDLYYQRIKALQEYANEYTNYGGCPKEIESSVKFIYKTGEIKAETAEE